jgi:ABC-type uncharacterized transport system permease subunit
MGLTSKVAPVPDIVLTTLNAKYIHAAFGLRYLMANLGDLTSRAAILEFDINQRPTDILEQILTQNPKIVGIGVYIWNVAPATQLVAQLKRLRPDITIVLGGVLAWYLRTDFGMAMRAVGDNPAMITAQGVDRRGMIELGLAIANGLVAFSGALIAQHQGFADVAMGVGTLVAGMAAVIMGETLLFNRRGIGVTILMVAGGSILFRGMVALALRMGLNPIDLKLATAAFVLLALALPKLRYGRFSTGAAQ